MKTLEEMLRQLARDDVAEFAIATGRLPCVKVGGQFQPVDDVAPTTERILQMLASAGGGRFVDGLGPKPVTWQARVDGVGAVSVTAALRDNVVQAKFVAHNRAGLASAAKLASEPEFDARGPAAAAVRVAVGQEIDLEPRPFHRPDVALDVGSAPAIALSGAPRTLAEFLTLARDAKASDLHLVAERPLLLRTGGELLPRGENLDASFLEKLALSIVPERLLAMLEKDGSCDFALDTEASGRARVNVSRQRTGYKVCIRLVPSAIPTLASLGLPEAIAKATHHHQGLILVTGPTGHGKTSTLAAIVDIINRDTSHHVITVEDPIEYLHPRKRAMMSQREVGSHTKSFFSALKGSLREDPDVIVVGELRDTETVRMALSASETGHLVIGTMNTPSAAKTIDRLIDLFPPSDQAQVRMTLAGGLRLIVSQRLLPRANGAGLLPAVELLPGSISLWSLIRDAKTYQIPSLQQRGKGLGIVRLDDSLAELIVAGKITMEAARMYAEQPDDLDEAVQKLRSPQPEVNPYAPKDPKAGLLGKAGNLFRKGG